MRGGALGVFATNTKPDMRTLRAQSVYHGLDGLLGHYGVRLNRDLVVDRKQNGVMNFPVRQGKAFVLYKSTIHSFRRPPCFKMHWSCEGSIC